MFKIEYLSKEGEVLYKKTYTNGTIFLEDSSRLFVLLNEVQIKYDSQAYSAIAFIDEKIYTTVDVKQNYHINPLAEFSAYFDDE